MSEPDSNVFTVEMGEKKYSLVTPDGTPGFPVPYEEGTATVMYRGVLHYAHVNDPDEFPEGGEGPTVFRVDSTTVVESQMQEVSDGDPVAEDGGEVQDEDDDEDNDEDDDEDGDEDEDGASGPGDVIEFPEPDDEEEDENLPAAE